MGGLGNKRKIELSASIVAFVSCNLQKEIPHLIFLFTRNHLCYYGIIFYFPFDEVATRRTDAQGLCVHRLAVFVTSRSVVVIKQRNRSLHKVQYQYMIILPPVHTTCTQFFLYHAQLDLR